MADMFRILIHRNDENIHLKLVGAFDDNAASELIDLVRIHSSSVSKIFIHTDSLDAIADYDEQNFKNKLSKSSNYNTAKILSTGRYSRIFESLEGPSFRFQ